MPKEICLCDKSISLLSRSFENLKKIEYFKEYHTFQKKIKILKNPEYFKKI